MHLIIMKGLCIVTHNKSWWVVQHIAFVEVVVYLHLFVFVNGFCCSKSYPSFLIFSSGQKQSHILNSSFLLKLSLKYLYEFSYYFPSTKFFSVFFCRTDIFLLSQKTCVMPSFNLTIHILLGFPYVRMAFSARLIYKYSN